MDTEKQAVFLKVNKKLVGILVLLTLSVAAVSAATASDRIALVIGNNNYQEFPLKNPANDATDIAAKLRSFGFDVAERTDINKRQFNQAIREFHQKLIGPGKIGLFFYAGHAVEIEGQNYLIPIATDIRTENDVEYESINAGRILSGMERAGNGLNMVILDACRNNPFRSYFRSQQRGIRLMSAPQGSVIIYSAQPGKVAEDGKGRNGTFTKHLLSQLDSRGSDVFDIFQQTAKSVYQETNGRQLPYIEGVLLSDFYFTEPAETVLATAAPLELTKTDTPEKTINTAIKSTKEVVEPNIIRGIQAHENGQWNEAFTLLNPFVNSTSLQAKTRVAHMLYDSSIRPQIRGNKEAGINLYKETIPLILNENNLSDQWYWVFLGHAYHHGIGIAKDHKEAINWYRKAAEHGNANAQKSMGDMYRLGRGVTKDNTEAVNWFRKAAEQGYSAAQNNLGASYSHGQGVAKDYTQAINWFRKAAENGSPIAKKNIGDFYYHGRGVTKNYAQAMNWYLKAAEQGDATAKRKLGNMYYHGRGLPKDYKVAMKWYREAANQGNARGMSNIGVLYARGRGVPRDYKEAMKWYRKAAEQGDKHGQYNLGRMYLDGYGGKRNKEEIFGWFLKAAEQGHKESQYQVGLMYHKGKGVKRDRDEAQKWYRKAADQGHEGATASLR